MDEPSTDAARAGAFTVSELNRQARTLLERGLARLWVAGELSNLARPASGHLYFTLKDDSAQIRCAYFRGRQRGPTVAMKDGDQMLALGRVSLYEARGDYQLIVEHLEAAGVGELRRQFEILKKKLAAEGLFDESLKRPLPTLPRCVGVITSPTGAAIRDILAVLKRRFPAVPVIVYPSVVQGEAAVPELIRALATAVRRNECDVLIVSRGGGSLEDLWAFNDERLARALGDCPIPVVSAVGHEVDFTIADFVADVRAPTPSGAAELVVPDQAEWQRALTGTLVRLGMTIRRRLEDRHQGLDWLTKRLAQSSPAATVARQSERLGNLRMRVLLAMRHDMARRSRRLEQLRAGLLRYSPTARLERATYRSMTLHDRLQRAAARRIEKLQQRLTLTARALNAVSPLATLERGYAIVSDANSGKVIRDARHLDAGDEIRARLASGGVLATVSARDPEQASEIQDDGDA